MKKRTAALLICALILFTNLSPVCADLVEERVLIGEAQASFRAKEIVLPVTFEEVKALTFLSATLTFDPSLGEVTVISEESDASVTLSEEAASDPAMKEVKITWIHQGDGANGTYTPFSLVFSIAPDAKPGEYVVAITQLTYDAEKGLSSVNGKVILTDTVIYGDCDSNGKVTVKDVLAIVRRIVGYENEIDVLCADVNLDDKIDIVDAQTILRNLAGWETARLGHRDKTEVITPATCQSPGEVRLTCAVCGDSAVVSSGKGGHEYDRGICKFCGERGKEYPFFAYCDYLKRYFPYDDNLRGYASYVTYKFDGYKLFVSNIYDTETESLCLFATAYFDNGLTSTVSVDIPNAVGPYKYYYECSFDGEVSASMTGEAGADPSILTVGTYSGDETLKDSHLQIAGAISYHSFEYMAKLLSGTELGISIGDFGITLG